MGSTSKKKHKKHKNKDRDREKKKQRSNSETNSANTYSQHQQAWPNIYKDVARPTSSMVNSNSYLDTNIKRDREHHHHHHHHHHHYHHTTRDPTVQQPFPDSLGCSIFNIEHSQIPPQSPECINDQDTTLNNEPQSTMKSPIKKLESSPVPNQPLRIVLKVHSGSLSSLTSSSSSSTMNNQNLIQASPTTTFNTSPKFLSPSNSTLSSLSDNIQSSQSVVMNNFDPQSNIGEDDCKDDVSFKESLKKINNDYQSQQSIKSFAKKLKKSKKSKKSKHKKHSHHHHHHHHHCKKHHGTTNNNNISSSSTIVHNEPQADEQVPKTKQSKLIAHNQIEINTIENIENMENKITSTTSNNDNSDNFKVDPSKEIQKTVESKPKMKKDYDYSQQAKCQSGIRLRLTRKQPNHSDKVAKASSTSEILSPVTTSMTMATTHLIDDLLDSNVKPYPSKIPKSNIKKEEKSHLKQLLLYLLKQLQRKDQENFFAQPVTDSIAPGYSSIIAHPMDLSTIKAKIPNKYRTLGDFKMDVKLMCDNAMKYNRPETIYYKAANKLWHYTRNKLFKKDSLLEYSKKYPKLTPLELSLMPSSQVMGLPSMNYNLMTSNGVHHNQFEFVESGHDLSNNGFIITNKDHKKDIFSNLSLFHNNQINLMQSTYKFGATVVKSNHINFHNSSFSSNIEGSYLNDFGTSNLSGIRNNSSKYNQLINYNSDEEELIDGLTDLEFIESVQNSAKKAQERLSSTGNRYHISYLENIKDEDAVLLHSIDCQPALETSSPLSQNQSMIKKICLESIYRPTENGRVEVNILGTSSSSATTSITSTISLPSNMIISTMMGDSKDNLPTKLSNNANNNNKSDHLDVKTKGARGNPESESKKNSSNEEEEEDKREKDKMIQELIEELLPSYGDDEFSLDYALSIAKFSKNSEYTFSLVTSLLSVLTDGEHRAVAAKFNKLIQEQSDEYSDIVSSDIND